MSVHDAAALAGRKGASNLKKALAKVGEEIDKSEGKDELAMKSAVSLREKLDRLCESVSLELRASESRSVPEDAPEPEDAQETEDAPEPEVEEEEEVEVEDSE